MRRGLRFKLMRVAVLGYAVLQGACAPSESANDEYIPGIYQVSVPGDEPGVLLIGQSNCVGFDLAWDGPERFDIFALPGSKIEKWDPPDTALFREVDHLLAERPYKAVIWFQGESDGVDIQSARLYHDRLEELLSHILIHSPVILVTTHGTPYSDMVNGAKGELSKEYEGVYMVDSSDLPRRDSMHLTIDGKLELVDRLRLYY